MGFYRTSDIIEKFVMVIDNISSGAKNTVLDPMIKGDIVAVSACQNGQVTDAACMLTLSIDDVACCTLSITTAKTAGAKTPAFPQSANTLTKANYLKLATGGESTGDVDVAVTIVVENKV